MGEEETAVFGWMSEEDEEDEEKSKKKRKQRFVLVIRKVRGEKKVKVSDVDAYTTSTSYSSQSHDSC